MPGSFSVGDFARLAGVATNALPWGKSGMPHVRRLQRVGDVLR